IVIGRIVRRHAVVPPPGERVTRWVDAGAVRVDVPLLVAHANRGVAERPGSERTVITLVILERLVLLEAAPAVEERAAQGQLVIDNRVIEIEDCASRRETAVLELHRRRAPKRRLDRLAVDDARRTAES